MTNQTNKFLYNQGAEGPGGNGDGTGGTLGQLQPKNFSTATFNFAGGDGKVLQSVAIDKNFQAKYAIKLGTAEIGQNKIVAKFTGDHQYAAKSLDDFNINVSDTNGLNDSKSAQGTVNQIVAGPGIFISAPNGQGVVTIGTEPLNLDNFSEDLHEVSWSLAVPDAQNKLPYGIPGQFTAVGANGSILRSRDGHNWVQLPQTTSTNIYGIASEYGLDIGDRHMEYVGVGANGIGFYGRMGSANGDSFDKVGQLSDQNGYINETLVSVITVPLKETVPYDYTKQFTGGISDYTIANNAATTSTGVPLYDLGSESVPHLNLMTYYIINSCQLRRTNGVPTLIFSNSASDAFQIKIDMEVSDIRFTPGTAFSGKSPYRYFPIAVNNDGTFFVDPVTGNYGVPISPGYLSDPSSDIPPLTTMWLIPFPNGQYYFSPYIRVTDAVNGAAFVADYIPTNFWSGNGHNTSFVYNFATMANFPDYGSYGLIVETWSNKAIYDAQQPADYKFTATFEIIP